MSISSESGKELRKQLFEQTLKTQAWAKEDAGNFYGLIGHDTVPGKFKTYDEALNKAKKLQIAVLADHAAWIVGDGNEYRGVVGKFAAYGN